MSKLSLFCLFAIFCSATGYAEENPFCTRIKTVGERNRAGLNDFNTKLVSSSIPACQGEVDDLRPQPFAGDPLKAGVLLHDSHGHSTKELLEKVWELEEYNLNQGIEKADQFKAC